jgi:transposase
MIEDEKAKSLHTEVWREKMRTPDEVAAMLRLRELGWGTKRIAKELCVSRNTVKRYLEAQGFVAFQTPKRSNVLADHEAWLEESFRRHYGNADVVRQDLARERGIEVSLRTVERAVAHLRKEIKAQALATVRFETPPGRQLQIDFGETRALIGGETCRLHLFVGTLGYSRRCYVRPFRHERQSAWFDGVEGAFDHFGGATQEVLMDNARALVDHHDAVTREVRFNSRLHAFARYWGFVPRACAPYRARTKGKDERGVGYVKRNAIAGHSFASWGALEAHLGWWMREVADVRNHGTTGEPPIERFRRDEAAALRRLEGRPPFRQIRDLIRRVQSDCCIEVDTNAYSVPWRLIGETVSVVVAGGRISIQHGGQEVAIHPESAGRRQRLVEAAHFQGLAQSSAPAHAAATRSPDLLRPLEEYEALVGGGW